jgi:transcriptional regulator with XRE-family HTH domain
MIERGNQVDRFVGERLQLHRTLARESQTRLAAALHVTEMQISRYENGKERIPPQVLVAAAEHLRVKISSFIDDFDEVSGDFDKRESN